jgi:hypothetical protein
MESSATEAPELVEEFPWKLLASLACSLLIVIGGMLWTYGIWRETNQKFHELAHVQELAAGLEAQTHAREASIR